MAIRAGYNALHTGYYFADGSCGGDGASGIMSSRRRKRKMGGGHYMLCMDKSLTFLKGIISHFALQLKPPT